MASKQFELGNMCDDLVDLTMTMCGKSEDSHPRFPRWTYTNYVDRMMITALDIQELVITCNEYRRGESRSSAQVEAAGKCVYLNHLIRIAKDRGYISQKQHDTWIKLVTAIKWKIVYWWKSDHQ